ncbi:hypothetical protein VKT23_007570 [Stygiomarasmius scandens]|uniref:Uncharacterized protein n=1 Tax=Marasmiellus scandens TaxID=2682957 RepID=A0ABR1JRG2_9AGAR
MSPRRNADAAHIAPYLTHEVSHLGQTTLIPPETAGRMRQAKKKKGRTNPTPNSSSNTKGSTTRQAQMDEEVRYNTGPRQIRVPNPSSSSRTADRRSRRQDRRDNYDDDIPDYPPPPFDEAIATPALSVCPSTTTLINHSSTNNPPPLPFQVDTRPSERNSSDSDSDGSLELVERPPEAGPVQTNDRGRRRSRDLDLTADDEPPTPTAPQPKRRHLSLSPLRIFPHKPTPTPVQDRALSANPASPYRSAAFFRSTTSLKCPSTGSFFRLPTSALSSTSLGKPDFGKGRFGKGKERSSESLDSWEVVPRDGEDSHSLLSAIESIASPDSGSPSPTSPIFTFPPQNDRPANTTVRSPSRTPPPSVSNSSTTLSTNTVTPPAIGPPLTAARTRLNTGESSRSMSPASQHRLQGQAPSPSPSRANSPSLQNYPTLDNVDDPQQIAVDMPLPPTPTAIPVSLASSAHDHDHPSSMSGDDPHVMNTSQRRVLQHLNSSMPLSTSNTSGQLPIRAATVSAPRSTRPVSALPTYHGPHGPPLMSSSSVGDPVGDILPPIPPRSHQRPTPTPLSISYIPSTYSNSTISPGSAVSSGTLTPTRTPTDSHSGKHYPGRPLPHPPTPPSDGGLSTLPSPLSPTPVPSPKSESGRSGSPTLPIQNHAAVTTTKSNLKSNSKHNPNSLSRSLQTPTTTSPNRARIVDSLYGSRELEIFSDADSDTFSTRTAKLSTSTCPEGLLIDLDSDESGNESKTWNGTGSRVLDFERLAASVARGATTSPPTFPTTRTNPGPGPLRPSSPAHSHQFHHQRPYASSISAPLSISATSSTSSGRSDYYDAEGTGTGSTLVTERDQLAQHHFEETRAANSRDTRTQSRAQVGYHVGNRTGRNVVVVR